jgi:predicted nucleic acid-binding Zn ribbon protein
VASRSIRDSQRKKIYDSEGLVFHPDTLNPTPEWKSLREVQDFVDLVTASDTWKALGVGNQRPISVRDGRGRRSAGANAYSDFITMPKVARSRWTTLHELSHIAETYRADWDEDDGWPYHENENGEVVLIRTTAAHGPEYAGIFLYLVRSFLSEEDHARLTAAFKQRRVKVAPVDRRCLQCGTVLVGSRSKFCSEKCRWTYHNHLRTERAEQGRQKICVVCGEEFRAKRVDGKTCSPRCRKRLSRRSQQLISKTSTMGARFPSGARGRPRPGCW